MPRPKPKKIEVNFDKVKEIMEFLIKNKMEKYSIRVYTDGTASLHYGTKKEITKPVNKLYDYLRKTFKE